MNLAHELGVTCVTAFKMDATKAVQEQAQGRGQGAQEGGDDAAGSPCDGLGGRRPQPLGEKALKRLKRRHAAMLARGLQPPPLPSEAEAVRVETSGWSLWAVGGVLARKVIVWRGAS